MRRRLLGLLARARGMYVVLALGILLVAAR
jgi:hypothetical protein